MRYLITGGAGFLGAALANRLVRDGHDVGVVDDLSNGDAARLDGRISFTQGDVANVSGLWPLLQGVECVYHLAARVHVPESVQFPSEYNAINVGGTVSVLEAMRDAGVQRVVLTSSGAIYGDQLEQPVCESVTPDPQTPYAVSKLAAESYVRTIGKLWGIETVCLRIFNAYGPNQPLRATFPPVIPSFLKRILGGGSVILHNDGASTRDFVYIDDVVDALVTASTATGIDREIINVGSGEETSVLDLMRLIEQITGKKAQSVKSNTESGADRLCADLTLARQCLNYEPRYSLEVGLRSMILQDERFQG